MIVLQSLLRTTGYQAVEKIYKQWDVKYVIVACKNCISTSNYSRINIFSSKYCKINNTKNFSSYRSPTSRAEDKIRIRDDIPHNYNLIYKSPLQLYCKYAYPLGLISTIFVPAFVFIKYVLLQNPVEKIHLGKPLFRGNGDLIGFTVGSIFVGISLIAFVLKFPFRIFHNPLKNEYIAVKSSGIPFKTKKMYFTSAAKVNSSNILLNLFKNSLYQIGSEKVILMEEYFRRPIDLEIMITPNKI